MAKGTTRASAKTDVLQGTFDLMVLQTLESMGPLHGYGIARRIEQISDDILKLNEGTVYAALVRLQHQRWISARWGVSENNRKAKFYALTKTGRGNWRVRPKAGIASRRSSPDWCVPSGTEMWARLVALFSRLAFTWTRARLDDETRIELDEHLELLAQRYVRSGMTPDEAHASARRRYGGRERGCRRAGRAASQIRRLVLRHAAAVLGTGIIAGVGGALVLGRWLSSLLFQTSPWDLRIIVTMAVLLTITGLVSAWLPARRASRMDPRTAMQDA